MKQKARRWCYFQSTRDTNYFIMRKKVIIFVSTIIWQRTVCNKSTFLYRLQAANVRAENKRDQGDRAISVLTVTTRHQTAAHAKNYFHDEWVRQREPTEQSKINKIKKEKKNRRKRQASTSVKSMQSASRQTKWQNERINIKFCCQRQLQNRQCEKDETMTTNNSCYRFQWSFFVSVLAHRSTLTRKSFRCSCCSS